MQNIYIAYSKSLINDDNSIVVNTLNKMIKNPEKKAIFFENFISPNQVSKPPSSSKTFTFLDQNLTDELRKILQICLKSHITLVCNYESTKPSREFIQSIQKLAQELMVDEPKIVIEDSANSDSLLSSPIDGYKTPSGMVQCVSPVRQIKTGKDLADCLSSGAQFVFTKHLPYTSFFVGTALAHFHWSMSQLHQIASATLLGYLLDGDLQAHNYPYFLKNTPSDNKRKKNEQVIAQLVEDGSFIITKKRDELANLNSILVQKLNEMSDPRAFITLDIILDISKLVVCNLGNNQVKIYGALGARAMHSMGNQAIN